MAAGFLAAFLRYSRLEDFQPRKRDDGGKAREFGSLVPVVGYSARYLGLSVVAALVVADCHFVRGKKAGVR